MTEFQILREQGEGLRLGDIPNGAIRLPLSYFESPSAGSLPFHVCIACARSIGYASLASSKIMTCKCILPTQHALGAVLFRLQKTTGRLELLENLHMLLYRRRGKVSLLKSSGERGLD